MKRINATFITLENEIEKNVSEKTLNILKDSGWEPNRKINISKYIDFLESKGFEIFPIAKKILEELGGITYKYQSAFHVDNSIINEEFNFIPQKGLGVDDFDIDDFIDHEEEIKEKFLVIGESHRGNVIVIVSESGKIYGDVDGALKEIGNNIYEALDKFCGVIKK